MGQTLASHLRSNLRTYFLALVLIVGTVIAYQPAWHGGYIWDDDYYLTKNPLLTAPDGLRRIWFSLDSPSQYFPLVYTMFRFEHALWGLNPTGYHLVNLLLHVANALLVWRLLVRLNLTGAWLAGMIFALHPVHVESVAWITERKNVLMGFFFLLALLAWIEFADKRTQHAWRFYALALGFYILALFAKSTACTLPAALLLILWLKKEPITMRRLTQIGPFVLLGLAMGLVAIWWERFHQGTRGPLFEMGVIERVLVASHAVWFYLSKLFWPSDLTFIYPRWNIVAIDPLAYVWLLALAVACVAIFFTRRFVGRGLEVAGLFYVATLSPLLGFVMLYTFHYTFVADHYQYLASIGPIAVVAGGLTTLAHRYRRELLWGMSFLILFVLGALTWRQSRMYSDIEALWRTTIARNPSCWMAYNNLGIVLTGKANVNEAVANYQKSLELDPNYAQAHYNLGNALLEQGEIAQAFTHSQKALALAPWDADAHVAAGNVLLAKGDFDTAIAHYTKAVELRPDDSTAHYNLGNALQQTNRIDEAASHYTRALRAEPNLLEAHLNLGNIFLQEKREREALSHYGKAHAISPDSPKALNNLAWLLASASETQLRDGSKAVELAGLANRFTNGENALILHTLAAAYAESGKFADAVETAQSALRLAMRQNEPALADELRREIKLYEAGSAYRAQ
jgi:tetratricopeptide (TPR) repeat protein